MHNPLKYLQHECDRRVRKMREEISNKVSNTNMKFYGSYSIKKKGKLQSRSIKEDARIINTRENEEEYAKKKYGHRKELIDMVASNAFRMGK